VNIKVGEVVGIRGVKVTLRIFEDSNKDTIFHGGERYRGVSIREHVYVQRGFRDIVCVIEGEYLDEKNFVEEENRTKYIRTVDAKPLGYFEHGKFHEGIKYLPMIKDTAFLLREEKTAEIYSQGHAGEFVIGEMLKNGMSISIPWERLFNSHIGVFGNTGSGKSNTLAKLFTTLLEQKSEYIAQSSKFIIVDFNGEYTSDQIVVSSDKTTLELDTRTNDGDKFVLNYDDYWNSETLSILFQATTNTQRPPYVPGYLSPLFDSPKY